MSREEQDVKDMITRNGALDPRRGSVDLDALAQLLADYEARIAALETELEVARRKGGEA